MKKLRFRKAKWHFDITKLGRDIFPVFSEEEERQSKAGLQAERQIWLDLLLSIYPGAKALYSTSGWEASYFFVAETEVKDSKYINTFWFIVTTELQWLQDIYHTWKPSSLPSAT